MVDKESEDLQSGDYNYLLSMPVLSLSEEKVQDLIHEQTRKQGEHDDLEKLHIY
jgi:hypothetical protein